MLINLQENRFPAPIRTLQHEREKKRLEAEEEKRKAKTSKSVREYSVSIPDDILIDIFSRVPEKSIGRFRCLSKFWESILGSSDFTELFLTKSVTTSTRLFFAVQDKEELLNVFSLPQPLNPNHKSSLVATCYKSFPKHFPNGVLEICNSLCGFFFLKSRLSEKQQQRVICNPVTGECITLPSLPNVTSNLVTGSYMGFDPINKQLKVLCMTRSSKVTPNIHCVLTLGTGQRIWRSIQDPLFPHRAISRICIINGVLYYIAAFDDGSYYRIVCFDFRFEKFSTIKMDGDMLVNFVYGYGSSILLPGLTLFNNKGTLGAYYKPLGEGFLTLWVLEDARNHQWSKRVCVLPPFLNNGYNIVGMTVTGEIVFKPYQLSKHFHIFYYNIESNTFTRVNIHGFEEFKDHPVIFTSLDYVESSYLCGTNLVF